MTSDRADGNGRRRPTNDNRLPDGPDADREVDVSDRLDAVVLSIARLIGRQIAREHFEALQAANDNKPRIREGPDGKDT